MQILPIQKSFETFKYKLKPLQRIRSTQIQIQTFRKGFKSFEWKF